MATNTSATASILKLPLIAEPPAGRQIRAALARNLDNPRIAKLMRDPGAHRFVVVDETELIGIPNKRLDLAYLDTRRVPVIPSSAHQQPTGTAAGHVQLRQGTVKEG